MTHHSKRPSLAWAAMLWTTAALADTATAQSASFSAARDVPTGFNPQCVAAGDFDGDGRVDLAVANRGSHDVSVLLGHGDGTFQAASHFAAGSGPTSLSVGDLDRDGIQDLAVGNFDSNDVAVLLGNGDGTFRAGGRHAVGSGPNFTVTGDFDDDGALDVAVANHGTSPESTVISVLLGNGDGSFQPARDVAVGRAPIWIAVGDFDGAGALDLAVANYLSGDVSVLLGNGDGTFQPARTFGTGAGPGAVEAGDLDGDGDLDLAVANYLADDVTVLLGDGEGTFQATGSTLAVGDGPVGLGVGELGGDGAPDLAVANWSQNAGTTVSVLLGSGGGAFVAEQRLTVGRGPASVAIADLDGDGSLDLAVANFAADTVSVLLNDVGPASRTLTVNRVGTGSGTVTSSPAGIDCGSTCQASFASGTTVTLTASSAAGSTFTGWSGGGCSGAGTCRVVLAASTQVSAAFAGRLEAPVLKWSYGGCSTGPYCQTGWYSSPAVADLDLDGRPEVIWGSYDVVALDGAAGTVEWRGRSGNRVWPGVAVADLTGDGPLEVVVGRSSDQLTVYDASGSVVRTRNPFGGGGELRTLAVDDLETDGQLEILVSRASGAQAPYVTAYGSGGAVRPGWPARRDGEPGYGWGAYNQNVAVADMDGDGRKEVFVPSTGHYVTALDRHGAQLEADGVYDGIQPVGRKAWSQVGVHVDHAVDLRGYADCGAEHRPNFSDSAPVVADLDGDGALELVVVGNVYDCGASPYASLYHMPFVFHGDRTRWNGGGFDWTAIPEPGPGSGPRSEDYDLIETVVPNPAVADLDGDGLLEIVFPSYDGRMHAYWLDKTQHGSWPYAVPTTGAPGDDYRFASEPVVADLDGDGRAEVLFASWPKKGTGGVGQVHVLDASGAELHRVDLPGPALGAGWNGGLGAPTLADVDGDADLELVVGTVASGVVAYDLPQTAAARVLWGTGRGSYGRTGRASAPD